MVVLKAITTQSFLSILIARALAIPTGTKSYAGTVEAVPKQDTSTSINTFNDASFNTPLEVIQPQVHENTAGTSSPSWSTEWTSNTEANSIPSVKTVTHHSDGTTEYTEIVPSPSYEDNLIIHQTENTPKNDGNLSNNHNFQNLAVETINNAPIYENLISGYQDVTTPTQADDSNTISSSTSSHHSPSNSDVQVDEPAKLHGDNRPDNKESSNTYTNDKAENTITSPIPIKVVQSEATTSNAQPSISSEQESTPQAKQHGDNRVSQSSVTSSNTKPVEDKLSTSATTTTASSQVTLPNAKPVGDNKTSSSVPTTVVPVQTSSSPVNATQKSQSSSSSGTNLKESSKAASKDPSQTQVQSIDQDTSQPSNTVTQQANINKVDTTTTTTTAQPNQNLSPKPDQDSKTKEKHEKSQRKQQKQEHPKKKKADESKKHQIESDKIITSSPGSLDQAGNKNPQSNSDNGNTNTKPDTSKDSQAPPTEDWHYVVELQFNCPC